MISWHLQTKAKVNFPWRSFVKAEVNKLRLLSLCSHWKTLWIVIHLSTGEASNSWLACKQQHLSDIIVREKHEVRKPRGVSVRGKTRDQSQVSL